MSALNQRVPTTTCAKCRALFKPGDRVATAFIVQRIARNPVSRDVGAFLGEDFELVHVSCMDTQLDGKIITPS